MMNLCECNDLVIRPMRESDIGTLLDQFKAQGWSKPQDVLETYLFQQSNHALFVFVAEYQKDIAGYTVLFPFAKDGPFANRNIPEISDLIVFMKYQRKGIGNKILDAAEKKASELCDQVSLAVGLHGGYGAAQRMYAQRGYVPDGSGVWYNAKPLEQYADCKNDDDLLLYLSKQL